MSHLASILRFAWPYLRQYKLRLTVAILAGILFAASNASFLFIVKVTIARILPPDQQQIMVSSSSSVATVQAEPPTPINGFINRVEQDAQRLKERVLEEGSQVIDPWLPRHSRPLDVKQIIGVLFFFAFFAALRSSFSYISSYCMTWVSAHFITDLRTDLLQKLYSLSLDFHQRSQVGDLTNRAVADTQTLYNSIGTVFADLIKEPATILAVLVASIFIDWHLTFLALVVLPACMAPIIILGNKVRRAVGKTVSASVAQSNLMIESLSGIRVVKAYRLEKENARRFREHSESIIHHNIKQAQAEGLINPSIEIISSTAFAFLILYVVWQNISLADMSSVMMGVIFFFAPIRRLGRVHVVLQAGSVSAHRLETIMKENPTVLDPPVPQPLTRIDKNIQIEDLSFSYGPTPVLQRINLLIPKGSSLGIAGESGSGKSTLVNLLLRFYDPTSGVIRIDDRDIRQTAQADLLRLIAMVSQEIVIFDTTIAENIGWGRPGATESEIQEAARRAHADEFIQQLPEGYQTRTGERGVTLSGGQRQRIAIARAFIRNAPILILDEATASLDSQSESEVQTAIDELAENRTVITIAHRLSTLSQCDQVVVLERGQIIEQGSYQQLLKQSGPFARMAGRQGILIP